MKILETSIKTDAYTEFVCDKYDIQDKNKVQTIIPKVNLDDLSHFKWNIAIIVGNSGSGKTTILNSFKEAIKHEYDNTLSCISQFKKLNPEEVAEIFHGVGLSSIPTWLKHPNELSNGEKARLDLAYDIINTDENDIIVVDEFTSVVNRQVAKSMSNALQRYIRNKNRKIIIASCHFDILNWLNPDVVFNLNKQINDEVLTERFIYNDNEEYNEIASVNKDELLTNQYFIQ